MSGGGATGWAARVGVLLVSVLLTLMLAEGALRLLGVEYPSFYVADPVLGMALRPGAEGRFTGEGDAHVRINSAGMRDRERPREKPPGTYRIALLGDSFALAKQVDVDDAFPRLVERALATDCAALEGRRVDVLNFGVSGYGTGREWLLLRERSWAFEPDLVALAFLTGNDLIDNAPDMNRRPLEPRFRLEAGEVVVDDAFRDSPQYERRTSPFWRLSQALIDHSRIVQVANEAKNALARRAAARRETAETAEERAEIGLDPRVYSPPESAEWKEAWELTEALLGELHDEVRARDVPLALVILSNAIQSHPDVSTRQRFMERHGIEEDLFYPDRRLLRFAARNDIPALALAPAFQRHAEATGDHLHGFENTTFGVGHWNETGHREASRRIAPFLCELVASAAAHDPAMPEGRSSRQP